jgi:hypothetical protein
MWPTEFVPRKMVGARRQFDEQVERRVHDPSTREAFGPLLERSDGNDAAIKAMEAYLDATIGNL